IKLGTPDSTSPTGPDPAGYLIYDDNDQSSGLAPSFDWYEIAPPGPGELLSAISDEDDDTTAVTLLFGFKFYGNSTNSIGISTNGLLEIGGASYPDPENFPIPDPGEPNSLIAALWEDLDPLSSGDIYPYLDYPNHRWIIEFKDVRQKSTGAVVTFQVMLLDPAYHETPTGDGEIIIQYASINSVASSCIGLEGPDGEMGLQYLYRGNYDLTASALDSGRVLLVSTRRPSGDSTAWIAPVRRSFSDESGGNGNGYLEPGETIELYLTLANLGDQPLEGTSLLLSSLDGDAAPIDSLADYGNMAPGQHKANENPLTFQVADSPADSLLEFDITITGENGYIAHAYVEFPLYSEVSVSENRPSASRFPLRLNSVIPNPVRSRSTITFTIPAKGHASLDLFDVSGRKVDNLFDGQVNPGTYRINWRPLDRRGSPLHNGIYFLSLDFEGKRLTKKLVVLR
ncbi:MAG: T9SS type A sorting domain-containing protein, partial [Candidatus Hydrothermae bacterium]|nr:T9SS type A sorting domain-containing protein [Candidatus Hydrothermae bacterium]